MNQEFMDPEIFSEFIVEAREHLENIEPSLLELEKSPDDPAILDDIFRLMHSLKGASGFLGLARINGLTHKAENILDEIRKGNMRLTPSITDIILSSTDALKGMVENLEQDAVEGDIATEPIIEKIDALLSGDAEPPAREVLPAESDPIVEPDPVPSDKTMDIAAAKILPDEESAPEGYMLTLVNEEHLGDFLEEARETVEQLSADLLRLEKNPEGDDELVNDIFRYFHNLKGNSGIIGYQELNSLTHEAETLLNKVRKGDFPITQPLIDLLLDVVDSMDELLASIQQDGSVVPGNTDETTQRVRAVLKTGEIPARSLAEAIEETPTKVSVGGQVPDTSVFANMEDVQIFSQTVAQQFSNMDYALKALEEDSSQPPIIDGLYRSFASIQNATHYIGLESISEYVEGIAGLVDQGRSADLDFSALLDILSQERGIIWEKIDKEIHEAGGEPLEKLVASSWGLSEQGVDEEPPDDAPELVVPEEEIPVSSVESAPEIHAAKPSVSADSSSAVSGSEHIAGASPSQSAAPVQPPVPSSSSNASKGNALKSNGSKTNGKKTAQRPKLPSTIRVDHTKLDHLMNLIGELIINRNRFAMLAKGLEEGQDVNEIAQKLSETTYSVGRISDDLQDTIMNVRMVPVRSVFSRFPRLVRDLSQKSGKKVELITEGEDTELDKSVVEEIGDPLVHLVRNAVDHGIESAADREEAEKSPTAKVWLRAFHKGNSVGIEVEDDGHGIDPDRMRSQAVLKGVITEEEARSMDDRAAIELMFAPGFSTAEKITDISGRGVGMDVVRNNIKNLKGSIAVQSELGKGSRITLTLPLTLAIIDALMIKVDNAVYAIPLDAVSETTKIETKRLCEVNGQKAVTLRGEVLGLVELAELLGLARNETKRDLLPTVILTVNDRRLGLVVDTLLERQDVVIKSLGDYLGDLPGISGATIMGDGSVVLILDPHEVYRMATSRAGI